MFIEQIILQLGLQHKKVFALDACAAPGGKSTHLLSLLSDDSFLVSNETIGSRVHILQENLIKWGKNNLLITNNDPAAFSQLENLFDLILVDAPCSGEGLFRKDKAALQEWSESNCELCVSRQQRILAALLPSLKPGGHLIFCTCTYNPSENERNLKWLLENYHLNSIPLVVPENCIQAEDKNLHAYYFFPHRMKGEGFFFSVLQKLGSDEPQQIKMPRQKKFTQLKENKLIANWLMPGHSLFKIDEHVYSFPETWWPTIEMLSSKLNVRNTGTVVAEMKGEKPIPTHELALSSILNKEAFPKLEVNHEQALKFLRKDELKLSGEQKSWSLISYQDQILGFVNAIGSRLNNYYPMNWRIRMRE